MESYIWWAGKRMYNPTMEVPVPTVNQVGLDPFIQLFEERQNLKHVKEDCEQRIKALDEEIGYILDQKEVKTVVWNDSLIIRRQASKGRPILDRVLLLEAGVTPQQLNQGTKYSDPGKPGITIRPISESKKAEEYAERVSSAPTVDASFLLSQ